MHIRNSFINHTKANILISTLVFLLASCGSPPKQESTALTSAKTVQAFHHKKLELIFTTHEYGWNSLDLGVPPLILRKFPNDLHLMHSSQLKKELFFRAMLPMAMLANEEVNDQRNSLKVIFLSFDQEGSISSAQQKQLASLLKRYRIKDDPLLNPKTRDLMLSRVDSIPESLILAQSANESGWGTSRFAREANNIFGEWTFTPGTGLVPEGRPEGEIYEVRRFSNLYQSVRSYMRNINTHRAYSSLREIRQRLRKNNLAVTGVELASGLRYYSTRRDAYSGEIESMIKSNQLEQLITRTYLRSDASVPSVAKVTPTTGLISSKEQMIKRTGTL